MHGENGFYGHRAVLARWCGVTTEPAPPIWGYLQHGVSLLPPFVDQRLLARLPKLVWGSRSARLLRDDGRRRVHAIGAPFLYLRALAGEAAGPALRGTIAYPFHGWAGAPAVGSHQRYARELAEREGVATVCLYWLEHADPSVVAAYEAAGHCVITHGRRSDPAFLERQLGELRRHRRAVANRVGTALFYAAAVGLEVEVHGPWFGLGDDEEGRRSRAAAQRTWPWLLDGPVGPADARPAAEEELGAVHLRAPSELVPLLGYQRWRRALAPAVRGAVALRRRALGLDDPDG